MLTPNEARALLDKALSFSKADEMEAVLRGGRSAYTRFGANSANTSGDREDLVIVIRAHIGRRSGAASTNATDERSLERAVRRAEEIARLRPEDPEQMPFVGKQEYVEIEGAFDQATYAADATMRAKGVAAIIGPAQGRNLVAAGLFDHAGSLEARANTRGNFGYHRSSFASLTTTVRTPDGTGSGWASNISHRLRDIDAQQVSARALEKAERSRNPIALEPGNYTVVLEPNAVGDLLGLMMGFFGARAADEGRSFFSRKGGGNRLGEKLFDERVHIYTDPQYAAAPGDPFDDEGLPTKRMDFVRNGVLENLIYSRYWAKKMSEETGRQIAPTPEPTNIIMAGGDATLDEMIRSTERGILVTRFWYIRLVDPRAILYTGLTRDGLFLIEKGRIKTAIKNFRFNESPVKMLRNIEAMSPPVRITGSERIGASRPVLAPALKVRDFSFTSLSDAV